MGGASRLAVRPTARGWQALIFGLLVLLVARLIGTTQFHQLAYALLALLLAALFIGWSSSRGLRFSRALPPGVRMTAGSRARIRLQLSNRSRLRLSGRERRGPPPRAARLRGAAPWRERRRAIEAPLALREEGRLRARAGRGGGRGPLRAPAFRPQVRGEDGGGRLPRGARAARLPDPGRQRRGRRPGFAGEAGRRVRGSQGVPPGRRPAAHPLEERGAHGRALRQGVRGRGAAALLRGPRPAPRRAARPRGRGRGRRLCRGLRAHPPRARAPAVQASVRERGRRDHALRRRRGFLLGGDEAARDGAGRRRRAGSLRPCSPRATRSGRAS